MVRPKPTAGLGVSVNGVYSLEMAIKWVILEVAKNGVPLVIIQMQTISVLKPRVLGMSILRYDDKTSMKTMAIFETLTLNYKMMINMSYMGI